MRKIILLVLVCPLYFSLSAQKLNIGLKFSPNFSWIKSEAANTIANDGSKIGFSYGLTCDYNFTNNYSLNIEILSKNIKFGTSHEDTANKLIYSVWKHQYIDVPFALKMKTNKFNDIMYFAKIGLCPMIKTGAKLNEVNNAEQINFFNMSYFIGAGVHYYLGGNTAVLGGLTFNNGLMRFNNKKAIIFDNLDLTTIDLKNMYIALDLGILF